MIQMYNLNIRFCVYRPVERENRFAGIPFAALRLTQSDDCLFEPKLRSSVRSDARWG